ncbi:MAG: DUF1344 domain-containing protein [Bauldia sp.]
MRAFVIAVFGFLALTASAGAQTLFAPPVSYPTDRSWITAVDQQRRLLYLNDGKTFRLGPTIDLRKLQVGMQARVAYEVLGGEPVAFAIVAGFYPLEPPEGPSLQDIFERRRLRRLGN